jgi:hypothetical protein
MRSTNSVDGIESLDSVNQEFKEDKKNLIQGLKDVFSSEGGGTHRMRSTNRLDGIESLDSISKEFKEEKTNLIQGVKNVFSIEGGGTRRMRSTDSFDEIKSLESINQEFKEESDRLDQRLKEQDYRPSLELAGVDVQITRHSKKGKRNGIRGMKKLFGRR